MSGKRATLIVMLRRFEEAQEVLVRSGEGSGGSPFLMPLTWNRSFREVERVLRVLREDERELYLHLKARYLDPWRMVATLPVKNGRIRLPARMEVAAGAPDSGARTADVVVSVWAEWVDERLVSAALDRLEVLFVGEPFLPEEMRAA